jgi:hypothetical protein
MGRFSSSFLAAMAIAVLLLCGVPRPSLNYQTGCLGQHLTHGIILLRSVDNALALGVDGRSETH